MPSFHRTAASLYQQSLGGVGPITLAYKRLVKSGSLSLDKDQLSLGAALDSLYSSLSSAPSQGKGGQFLIPDEHVESAARYYADGSSSSSLLSSSSWRRWWSMSSDDFAGISMAMTARYYNNMNYNNNNNSPIKGIYVHGSVGVGKSMLMDLFHIVCAEGLTVTMQESEQNNNNNNATMMKFAPLKRRHKRWHFHEFMLDVHQRIHAYKSLHPKADPMPYVAASLAKEARLLCFDEMQITDIADAMIVKRLFTILLELGVVVVTTSNRPPCGLYEGGINRSVFLPFIETLNERMIVFEMGGSRDYRRDGVLRPGSSSSDSKRDLLPTYVVCSATDPPSSASRRILEDWFSTGAGNTRKETIPVAMGRSIHVQRANDSCGWFTFDELCKQPLGAADYIAIGDHFDVIIVEDVPQLCGHTYNEARRFVTLIDALYEARTKLIIAAGTPQDELFVGFDATVESADGDEELAIEDSSAAAAVTATGKESFVVGEGGSSSSSSTTMIQTPNGGNMEWSATGMIGVSLAQLSAVREVSFSFARAESRLAEMAGANWGR